MADRYWVQNGGSTSANTASAWNTTADGSGSAGIPTTNDNVHIGHADTLGANKGNAVCLWDLALTLTSFTTYAGYNTATVTASLISFTAGQTITHANTNWADLGFRVGMQIVVSGASNVANNGTFDIAGISSNAITTTQSTLQTESAGPAVTVVATIKLAMNENITTTKFTLDTTLRNSTGSNKTITLSGAYPSGTGNRYVLNGENAVIENQDILTYTFNTSANGTGKMKFDDGPYPNVTTAGTSYFTPEYVAPTYTEHNEATFYSMNIGSASTFAPDASPSATSTLNASKVFEILNTSTFAIGGTTFDAGFSTFAFTVNATNWTIPVTGDTTFGTAPFVCRFYNFILRTPATAGFKALVPNNRTLSVNSLTVEADAVLKGHITAGSGATSTVCSVRRPVIKGSWNFSQLSDGVYVSLMSDTFPITPSDGPATRVQLSNAGGTFTSDEGLSFANDTLHADKGIKLTEGSDHPIAPSAATGLIWVKNTAPSTLIFTDDAGTDTTLGAGGGGGITALTGDVTASGSGSVAATIAAGAVEHAMLDADCVDGDNIADDSINSEHYVDGSIDTAHIADDQVTAAKLANSINSEITANTAKVTNATHSGEVTGATALTIADDVVDEANLKVSNSPTNGYALTAQSAASGGLTWAAMSGGTALEFAEWRLENHDPSTSGATGGSFKCLDLADTSFWAQATTSSDHTSIVLHSDGYVTLAANGIYDVWFSADLFGTSTSAGTDDCWLSISTNNSNDRRYATQRDAKYINGTNVKWNTQCNAKIKTGGSPVNIYFGGYIIGSNFYFASYNDYRTSVKIIRLGDA